jgi:hypothetical protein
MIIWRGQLKVQDRVEKACVVTDLEGDDTLDLVASDMGGYLYAWKIGKGSVYQQPWPYEYGNSWATACKTNKPSGNVGYLYEDWQSEKIAPYSWTEYDANNSTAKTSGNFIIQTNNKVVTTSAGDKRNMFFQGPTMKAMKNYVVSGKMKFDNADAEFGVSFYGQWPDLAKKYEVRRKADNVLHLYYIEGATETELGAWDTASYNDSLKDNNQWYNYQISVSPSGSPSNPRNKITVWTWKDGSLKPSSPVLNAVSNTIFNGFVGLVAVSGSGNKYWGPIKVISAEGTVGAYIANEDFKEDTVVDVKPYVPAAMHPDYTMNQFSTYIKFIYAFRVDNISATTYPLENQGG